jgi:hypothetical protein
MTNHCLKSPDESIAQIAQVFACSENRTIHFEVWDDKCFKTDSWLRIGALALHPAGVEQDEADAPIEHAIRFGAYSWKVPTFEEVTRQIETVYQTGKKRTTDPQKNTHSDKTRRALEGVVDCAVKCGFINPIFDAGSVAEMPFSRPTTIVVDTSAILKGGLDFIIRFLYPMARIKIPAIAHMEILMMADNYFKHRRSSDAEIMPAGLLYDHVTSQGAQRVLLRLELQTEAEIERPRLGADPLRGVVLPATDSEDRALGLQHVQRSFADRLILETAIQHRDRLSPDHPIVVLTADQGLARMTLAEGLHTLFFSSPDVAQVFGRTLAGTGFRPFIDDMGEAPLFHIPLTSLLWEMACTFGSTRLVTEDKSASITISAIGEDLSWHPFHSRDDLLWTMQRLPQAPQPVAPAPSGSGNQPSPTAARGHDAERPKKTSDESEGSKQLNVTEAQIEALEAPSTPKKTAGALKGSYRFSVSSMIDLVLAFERKERIADREAMRLVGLETAKRYQDFRNFLLAGQFAERTNEGLLKLPVMDELIHAIKGRDLYSLKVLCSRVPSVLAFLQELAIGRPVTPETVTSIARGAFPTYVSLAEVFCGALDIPREGAFGTPNSPPPSEFAPMALDAYRRLKGGEEYVLIGKWMEELARRFGVHPIRARERLNEAREARLLERYTEGSTPETQFERHNMAVLELHKGTPSVRTLNLYHGDFLIPGKASVSIRLEEMKK